MRTIKLPFYARLALTLLAIVLIFFILRIGDSIFIPLVFALLVSILVYPFCKFLEHKVRMGRVGAAVTTVLLFVFGLVGFIYFLTLQMIRFSEDFPQLRMRFLDMFSHLQHWMSSKMHINTRQQTDYINKSATGMLETVGHSLSNVFMSVTSVLLLTIFVIIFTFFMLYHRKLLMRFVLHLFSVDNRPKVSEVVIATKSMIYGYVLGLMIEMVVLSVVNSVMFLIMGIEYALLLGVMAAVLNVIPYLGIYSAMVITMLVTFANSTGNAALVAGIGLFAVHVLDSNILFPRIVGGRVKMNPFITIIAVIVGELLWGVPGMFLFIPITGIIKLICERVEGLEAWALLIGVEEVEKKHIRKVAIKTESTTNNND